MATQGQRYDHPNCTVRREYQSGNLTGIASTTMHKVLFFQAAKLKQVHSLVVTAGTDAAAGVDIYVGTTSVGAITHGTAAASTFQQSAILNSTIPAQGHVDIRGKAGSATMVNSYTLEFEVTPDAVNTV